MFGLREGAKGADMGGSDRAGTVEMMSLGLAIRLGEVRTFGMVTFRAA